jgi:hypothetical protein
MLDTRHLIITAVSIFLALMVGVLVGVGITQQPQLEKLSERFQQDVQKIQQDVSKAREDIADARASQQKLEAVLEDERRFLKLLLPVIVDNRLANRRVALIQTSGLSDFSFKDPLTRAIQQAGATVTATIVVRPEIMRLKDAALDKVLTALGVGSIAPEQAVPKLCRQLTKSILEKDSANRLRVLVESGCIEVTGTGDTPVDSLVLIGGSDREGADNTASIDLPILAVCRELGKRCVATEPEKVAASFMGPYQTEKVTTVDNVDSLMGQICVVYALAGATGNFGVKDTADTLLPPDAAKAAGVPPPQ